MNKRCVMIVLAWMGLLPVHLLAQTIRLEVQGGPQLLIRAQAEQQQWIVLGGKILVAAVIDGRLVVQEFLWPTEPQPPDPGPQPKPDPKPDPQPDPPPPQPTRWQAAFFVESNDLDNLSADQKALLASLLVRKDLEAKGHCFLGVLDPDAASTATDPALQAWFSAAKGKAPCMAIAPMEGGTIRVYPLPADKEALWKLLENPPAHEATEKPKAGQPRCYGGRCFR